MDIRNSRKLSDVVSIQRSTDELYAAWKDPAGLASIVLHLLGRLSDDEPDEDITQPSGPVPQIEIVRLEPGRRVEWQARVADEVRCRGVTEFTSAPPGRGSEVRVAVEIDEDQHLLKRALAKFNGNDPLILLREDLRNFKQFMETGEFATTRGQPAGERSFVGGKLVQTIQRKLQREIASEPVTVAEPPNSATEKLS